MKSLNTIVNAIYAQSSDKIGRISRELWRNRWEQSKLHNQDFSLISQNCIGSIMYHDLGQKFLSPTINMKFEPNGFVDFLCHLPESLNWKIRFIETDKSYPVGYLGNSFVEFVHYHTEEEVVKKWTERKDRVNWNNVMLIACDSGMTQENMLAYDRLPFRKILFSTKKYEGIQSCCLQSSFPESDARLLNFSGWGGNAIIKNG